MRRLIDWILGFSLSFVFFCLTIQILIGMATGQNFMTMTWQGSALLSLLLALIFGSYSSLENR
jgi:hypothetical protein